MPRERRHPMKRKSQRLVFVSVGLAILAVAVGLALWAAQDSMQFFYSPSDLAAEKVSPTRSIRLGGLVETGSFTEADGLIVEFSLTDGAATTRVTYDQAAHGLLPDLFKEGQGVIVTGNVDAGGSFTASEVLAKHDETYMPPEVADALKRSGEWREAPE